MPVEIGWCLVEDHAVVDRGSVILDWTRPGTGVDFETLRSTLAKTAASMRDYGASHRYAIPRLQKEGVDPKGALGDFAGVVNGAVKSGYKVVGFNVWTFDRGIVTEAGSRFGVKFDLPPDSIVDVLCMERAVMSGRYPPVVVQDRGRWYATLQHGPGQCRLHPHCFDRYKVAERLGGVTGNSHTAEYDAVCTHHVLQGMREEALRV